MNTVSANGKMYLCQTLTPSENGKKNSGQTLTVTVNGKMACKAKVRTVYKKEHTKVFNKKLGCYVDDYPLDKYLIKNSRKIIYFTQVKENLYAIIEEDPSLTHI